MTTIDINVIYLDHGKHDDRNDGHCFMEVVSMFAKEPFTDSPKCVSPYLRSFGIHLNDRATDERRQDLRRFIPLVVGTAGDGKEDLRRYLGADYAIRVATPRWLERAGLTDHAEALRALAPVTDDATYTQAYARVRQARDAAWKLRNERFEPLRQAVRTAVTEKLNEQPVVDAAAAVVDVAVAAVDAVVDVAAVAAVAVATVAAVDVADRYWAIRNAVYDAVYARVRATVEERYADLIAESWNDALALYERLINPGAVTE